MHEQRTCPGGGFDCPAAEGFDVTNLGEIRVALQSRGKISPEELSALDRAATALTKDDLSGDPVCDNNPLFVAEEIRLDLTLPDSSIRPVLVAQVEGGTCLLGDRERVRALTEQMTTLAQRYDSHEAAAVCTAEFVFGVRVEVVDPEGAPIGNVSGTLTEGTFTEAMQKAGNELVGAGERAGTYQLRVQAPGFLPYEENGILVTADECHVQPVKRTVVMSRAQ